MRRIIIILTVLILQTSCNDRSEHVLKKDSHQKSEEVIRHKKMLGFKTSFLAEMGDENYDLFEKKLEKGITNIKYINDIIYISYFEELNSCGQYDGNIEISKDTIKLKVNLISDEVCTSLSIKKITFIIDNPDEDKKVILKK